MISFVASLIFVLFAFDGVRGCDSDICGIGSTFGQIFYEQSFLGFFAAYHSSPDSDKTLLQFEYSGLGSGNGRRSVSTPETVSPPRVLNDTSFGASDIALSSKERTAGLPNILRNYPLVIGTIAIQTNKPGLIANETIRMPRDVLADIFMGVITQWNDTRIVSAQTPGIAAAFASDPNPIYVLVRDESSGSTNILTEYFINASPTWNATYGPVPLNVFPTIPFISKRYLGDVMVSAIEVTPHAITYIPGAAVASCVASRPIAVQNKQLEFVIPNTDSIVSVVHDVTIDDDFVTSPTVDTNATGSYPLTSPTYLLTVQNNNETFNCTQRRLLMLYINFIYGSSVVNATNAKINFAVMNYEIRTRILEDLATYECGSDNDLSYKIITIDPVNYYDLWIATGIIGGIGFIVLFFSFIFYLIKEVKGWMYRVYSSVLVFSTLFLFLTIIPWVMIPTNNSICLARIWMIFYSVFMVLAATASRTDVLRKTYITMKKEDLSSLSQMGKEMNQAKSIVTLVFRLQIVVIIVQFIVLIIWTFVESYVSEIVLTDETLRTGEYRCVPETYAYFIVEGVLYTLIVALGLFNVYSSWSISSRTAQTKWLLMSLYNFMVSGIIVTPLMIFLPDNKSTGAIVASIILFLAYQAIFCFFVPGLIEASDSGIKRLRRASHSRSSSSRKGTTMTNTSDGTPSSQ